MIDLSQLKGKTAIITGSSRGIGQEIAMLLAKHGAQVVITGKTTEPHPKLEGTIFSVAQQIEAVGGKCLAIELDVREDAAIQQMIDKVISQWGGIDILVNNASAIVPTATPVTPMKKYDLMMSVNVRATYACTQACYPYLKKSHHAHVLNLSPPLNMKARWFKDHVAYTLSKYGMSLCTFGMAEEFKTDNIAVNSLWPKTTIATAAIKNLFPPAIYRASRTPQIVAKAAASILCEDSRTFTGNFIIDEEYLRQKGETDFSQYAIDNTVPLQVDYFIDS